MKGKTQALDRSLAYPAAYGWLRSAVENFLAGVYDKKVLARRFKTARAMEYGVVDVTELGDFKLDEEEQR